MFDNGRRRRLQQNRGRGWKSIHVLKARTTVKSLHQCPSEISYEDPVLKRTLIKMLLDMIYRPSVSIQTRDTCHISCRGWSAPASSSPFNAAPTFLFMWENCRFCLWEYPSAKHSSESELYTIDLPGVFWVFHIKYIKLLYCRGDKTLLVIVIMPVFGDVIHFWTV